jgi:LytS/YehU family sensor histidine kinase
MLIQNLVENAIKHGISRLPQGGRVHVAVWRSPRDLHIRVTNTGTLAEDSVREGIGVTNSRERLRHPGQNEDQVDREDRRQWTGGIGPAEAGT